ASLRSGAAAPSARTAPSLHDALPIFVSNGGGLAVLATDTLVARGVRLAELASETIAKLDAVLPPTWSRANPVDLIGDAPGARFEQALRIVLDDPGTDVVLVLHAPTAVASSVDAARAVARVVSGLGATRAARPSVFTSWIGGAGAEPARRRLRDAGVATFDTPDDAIAACAHLLRFRRNQELLMETPASLPELAPRAEEARAIIAAALEDGRELLSE